MDRFDIRLEVPAVAFSDLDLPPAGETSAIIAARVAAARMRQTARFERLGVEARVNADATGKLLEEIAQITPAARAVMTRAAERFGLSARGYHRVLRLGRTIADLALSGKTEEAHILEAVSYRISTGRED